MRAPVAEFDPGRPAARLLADGRLHLQHGPIDLIIEGFGEAAEVTLAYRQAWQRFQDILPTLVTELPLLRRQVDDDHPGIEGPVARRMLAACQPHAATFITPMAAVAGAVADEVLAATIADRRLAKAYVNNGGDIAFHLAAGETLASGVVGNADCPALDGIATITAAMPVRGIATSGWRGRSFSCGIADAATILARDGAAADAAATLVANAIKVGRLGPENVALALADGTACAEAMCRAGLIHGAVLVLQRQIRIIGDFAPQLLSAA